MTSKKHFLVIWPTKRKDWVSTFHQLSDDFNFIFISSTFAEEPNFANDFECRYWSEFDSAIDVLDDLRPDGIIFMSIETGLTMTLNYLAKKRGLKTYILQHGIFTNYKDYRTREKLWRKETMAKTLKGRQLAKGFNTFHFLRKSLSGFERVHLPLMALYTKLQLTIGPNWVARYLPLGIKRADEYLCYSPYNATIHKETDRVSEDQIKYVGSPELDLYLKREVELLDDRFYLHIDQALAENSFGEETVSKNEMTNFYLKLNEFCKRQKALLYIKLHPESYHSNWLPIDKNIVYLKQLENFNLYIQSSIGCFGFYSTMVIPALYWKKTILFNIQYSGLQEVVKSLKLATVLNFWTFESEDITFSGVDDFDRDALIETFFYSNDGGSIGRIKNALLN